MFIKFLIVIFMIFIVYLFFSNDTILEGMKKKKGGKKLKTGKKGGLKMRAKKTKKKVVDAVEDAAEDAVEGGEDVVPTTDPLALLAAVDKLSKTITAQQKDLEFLTEQIKNNKIAAANATPQATSDDIAEEEDDGDLGI